MSLQIIITEDGSHSLKNTILDETYHSIHGAIEESIYVYIKAGLEHVLSKGPEFLNLLEIGFGTGLNTLLTAIYAGVKIEYTAVENYPLKREEYLMLNYAAQLRVDQQLFTSIHECRWDELIALEDNFSLKKISADIRNIDLEKSKYDLVYYDAFAPGKQPEMWELPLLKKVYKGMNEEGVLVTYCAKGQVKRDLKSLGLNVESLPGPPGKFEMVRATKSRKS